MRKEYSFYLCVGPFKKALLLAKWWRNDMDEVRETACAMAVGTSIKYKNLKIKVFEGGNLVFSTCIGKGDLL